MSQPRPCAECGAHLSPADGDDRLCLPCERAGWAEPEPFELDWSAHDEDGAR